MVFRYIHGFMRCAAAEKNCQGLKELLKRLPPGVRLAFVGDGPQRAELEKMFKNEPVVFMVRAEGAQPAMLL
jgi:sulfoquinovosyltransferase